MAKRKQRRHGGGGPRKEADVALSDKIARSATSEGKQQRIIYDGGKRAISGFGLRVTSNDAKSFILTYRTTDNGDQRRMTIGAYPEWSVEKARKRASELKRQVGSGKDPLQERREAREAPTVADLCDRYTEEHLPKKRESSRRDDEAMIDQIIKPKLGRRKVAAVNYDDVEKLHQDMEATPYRANRVLALMSKNVSRWPSSGAIAATIHAVVSCAIQNLYANVTLPQPN